MHPRARAQAPMHLAPAGVAGRGGVVGVDAGACGRGAGRRHDPDAHRRLVSSPGLEACRDGGGAAAAKGRVRPRRSACRRSPPWRCVREGPLLGFEGGGHEFDSSGDCLCRSLRLRRLKFRLVARHIRPAGLQCLARSHPHRRPYTFLHRPPARSKPPRPPNVAPPHPVHTAVQVCTALALVATVVDVAPSTSPSRPTSVQIHPTLRLAEIKRPEVVGCLPRVARKMELYEPALRVGQGYPRASMSNLSCWGVRHKCACRLGPPGCPGRHRFWLGRPLSTSRSPKRALACLLGLQWCRWGGTPPTEIQNVACAGRWTRRRWENVLHLAACGVRSREAGRGWAAWAGRRSGERVWCMVSLGQGGEGL